MLHVPDTGLLVAGDVVYNGVHLYLTESDGVAGIDSWLAALDVAEVLEPKLVIAGHKNIDAPDLPGQIGSTREYLNDARGLLTSCKNAQEFYEAMMGRQWDRINPGALWRCGHHFVAVGVTIDNSAGVIEMITPALLLRQLLPHRREAPRASMALTLLTNAFFNFPLPTEPRMAESTRPFTFLPSRTMSTSTSVVPSRCGTAM